jgi:hypothetical protein
MNGEKERKTEESADDLRHRISERLQNLTPEQLVMFITEVEILLSQECQ